MVENLSSCKKICSEFTVDVVQFIFAFTIGFLKMFLVYLFEVMEVVGIFQAYILVNTEEFMVFFGDKSVSAGG